MSELIDYYQVLRVPPDVDLTGLQQAYARLAQDFAKHLGHDDARRTEMEQLNEAYHVLADPKLRVEYDRELFADEYESAERAARRARTRAGINYWVVLATLGAVVLIESVTVAIFGYSNVDAAASTIADGWGEIWSGVEWTWSKVDALNDSIGNPIGWFGEIGDTIGDLGR